ncbi:MAG: hypothetical protein QM756_19580 [Polyangiaceae bacterium]
MNSESASVAAAPAAEVTPEPAKPARSTAPKPSTRKISAALQRAVQGAGEAWAVDSANALRDEGRQVTGGWPGTITEARQRVRTCALLLGSSMNSEDLEILTRLAYETAKKVWLARSERVSDD